jgi:hypothetical protein
MLLHYEVIHGKISFNQYIDYWFCKFILVRTYNGDEPNTLRYHIRTIDLAKLLIDSLASIMNTLALRI